MGRGRWSMRHPDLVGMARKASERGVLHLAASLCQGPADLATMAGKHLGLHFTSLRTRPRSHSFSMPHASGYDPQRRKTTELLDMQSAGRRRACSLQLLAACSCLQLVTACSSSSSSSSSSSGLQLAALQVLCALFV